MNLKIGSIVIDCVDFDKMLAFWSETLRYSPREPAKGGWGYSATRKEETRTFP